MLGAPAVGFGWLGHPWAVTIAATVAMTVATGIDWMIDKTPDANLARIGVSLVAVGTF